MDIVNTEEMKELLTSPVKEPESVTNGDATSTDKEQTLDSGTLCHSHFNQLTSHLGHVLLGLLQHRITRNKRYSWMLI